MWYQNQCLAGNQISKGTTQVGQRSQKEGCRDWAMRWNSPEGYKKTKSSIRKGHLLMYNGSWFKTQALVRAVGTREAFVEELATWKMSLRTSEVTQACFARKSSLTWVSIQWQTLSLMALRIPILDQCRWKGRGHGCKHCGHEPVSPWQVVCSLVSGRMKNWNVAWGPL